MARKVAAVTIEAEGRDYGKIFHLREMSAHQTATWITRALLLLTHSGIDIPRPNSDGRTSPEELMRAAYGALMNVQYEELEPLLVELMRCVSIQPDSRYPNVVRPIMDNDNDGDDIEEYSTRFKLLWEIFRLHTGIDIPAFGAPEGAGETPPPPGPQSPESSQGPQRGPRPRGPAPGVRR